MTTPAQLRQRVLPDLGIDTSDVFTVGDVRREGERLELDWHLDGLGTVTETYVFHGLDVGGADPALTASVDLLHLFAGLSYWKATLPPTIHVPAGLSDPVRDLLRALVEDGLAELAHDHGTDLRGHVTITGPRREPTPAGPTGGDGVVVPVGGGKDSIVTLEALRHLDPTLIAINPKGPIDRTFDQAGLPQLRVTRTLDPALFAWNDRGAINGHVPITAIVSAACLVATVASGGTALVLSNESSADEATVVTDDGHAVNHQWSKSSAFEEPFTEIVRTEVASDVRYVSFLRPATELLIARRFASLDAWLPVFNSCNRAFHLFGERREWCGECPKCRFVFLVLAPFAGREAVLDILGGRNLLDDPAQVAGYAELLGFADTKPFECVGEVDECRIALRVLAADPVWADDHVVAAFASRVGPLREGELDTYLVPRDPSSLPEPFRAAFTEMFG